MLEIYLGKNTQRNKKLLSFCHHYGISYQLRSVEQLDHHDLMRLFSKTPDCFEILSPQFARFRSQEEMCLSDLITLVLRKPLMNLKLPLVIHQNKVYSDVSLDEARTFIPRHHKQLMYRDKLVIDNLR